ncbi:hypothetical protein SLE2022_283440 [Rubroshorea leprosula]
MDTITNDKSTDYEILDVITMITLVAFFWFLWIGGCCCRKEREANSEDQPQRLQQQNDIERGLPRTNTHLPQTLTREPPQQAACSRQQVIIIMVEFVAYDHENMQNRSGPCSSTCAICLDDFKDGDNCAVIQPCQHMYHRGCIGTWLKLNQHCPYCRGSPTMERLQILVSDQSSS